MGRVTVWADVIEINTVEAADAPRVWDATPDEVEAVSRQFAELAAAMRAQVSLSSADESRAGAE